MTRDPRFHPSSPSIAAFQSTRSWNGDTTKQRNWPRKTAELIKRIERYRNDASVPESLRPQWQNGVEGLDKLVDVLTLWTGRFQETAKGGKFELEVSRDGARTLIHYLRMILELFLGRELDRSKEVERFVAKVLEIADPGMKKKNIGWQIRTAN